MGQTVLRVVQYGLETTHGTNVAADTKLLMVGTLPDSDREIVIPTVDMGVRTNKLLSAAYTRRVLAEGITLEQAEGGAYFECLPLIFSMGIKASTGTEQTSGQADYLWTFAAPQTGDPTAKSITLEVADNTQAYEIGYVMANQITLSGDCDTGEVNISVECFGERIEQTTVTGGLSLPTAHFMTAKLSRLYIDDTWAGLGGTEIEDALANWQIVIDTGLHPKMFGSAQREFDSYGQGAITATATLTLERTAAVAAEELLYRPASTYTPTPRYMRLTVTGDQIGSGDNHTLQIDIAGTYTQWTSLGSERDGNTLDVVVLESGYDTTGTQALSINVTTGVQSI